MKIFKSLKLKMALTFSATMLLILMLIFSMLSLLMSSYYLYRDEQDFIRLYNEILILTEETGEAKAINYKIDMLIDKSNISVIISDSDFLNVYSSSNFLTESKGVFFDLKSLIGTVEIPADKDYVFRILEDENNSKRMFLKGRLYGDYSIYLTKSLETIIRNVDIYKDFLLLVSIPVIIVGFLVSFFVSKSITKPIYEMIDISKRISKLDFSKKYKPHGTNELNVLGTSLNKMGDTLSENITQLYKANTMLKNDITQRERNEKMRKEFLQNASHELKTPIAVIGSYGQMLKEGLITDKEDLDYYYDVICDETDKMANIVKELLVLAQLESYGDILNIESFNITELLLDVIETYDVIAKGEGVKFKVLIEKNLIANADKNLIERVISNYISNAIYHLKDKNEIYITLKNTEDGIYFSVKNKTDKVLDDKIWQSFYKDVNSQGNGLGLSIVKTIMEVHNKKCGVKCEDGFAEFYIIL